MKNKPYLFKGENSSTSTLSGLDLHLVGNE